MFDDINPYTIFAGVLFSVIGMGAFGYGRKLDLWKPKLIGGMLAIYPYFIYNKWAVWIVGISLTVLLWFHHDE